MSVRDYYDTYWTEDGFLPTGRPVPPFQAVLDRHVPVGSSVLDLGCGDGGANGRWLFARGAYRGVDISRPAVDAARAAGLDAQVIEDAARLPFGDGAFDAVVSAEVLEHLFAPQDALAEVRRVLRPGGVVVVSVPNAAYWRRRADLAVLGRWNPMGDDRSTTEPWRDPHIRFYTLRNLRALLSHAGFEVLEAGGHGGTVTGDIPGVRRLARARGWTAPDWRPHPLYGRLEARFPGLLGYRLHAVARGPG